MRRDAPRAIGAFSGVGLVTLAYARWLGVTNATTVALTFLLVVLQAGTPVPPKCGKRDQVQRVERNARREERRKKGV